MWLEVINKKLNKKRKKVYSKWDRILPTNELFFDRWEKAEMAKAGTGSSIYDSSIIMGEVNIRDKVWIGPWVLLDGTGGGITINDYCSISAGVQVYTHDTVKSTLSGGKEKKELGRVKIGQRCYIAPMCIIGKGVEIGDCSVVAANSFVNKSFPQNSIIAGTPAIRIGKVQFDEEGKVDLKYFKNVEVYARTKKTILDSIF